MQGEWDDWSQETFRNKCRIVEWIYYCRQIVTDKKATHQRRIYTEINKIQDLDLSITKKSYKTILKYLIVSLIVRIIKTIQIRVYFYIAFIYKT